ncbi:c-type cytochrome [Thiomonas intermedia]|uniref:c-type cytochrome n=1 Tax=Thiomonas intermedia TaxID=926 RepID=UPI0009A4D1F2|nr:c-type cytochrome [Thiomonas intermedia]
MPTPKVDVRVALIAAGLLLASVPSWGAEKPAGAASSVVESSFPVPTAAQLQAGAKVAQTCAACHGADGNATSTAFPKLAGQHADYLVKQLNDYRVAKGAKHPARVNAIMNGMAATLTDAQIRDVALFYSRQTFKPGVAFADKKDLKLGQSIWMAGIPDRAVPACVSCHGPGGAGMPSRYPRIGGQWQTYLETELQMFRNDRRTNSPEMHDIASRMTDRQITAVADYAAGLRAPSELPR